jgi:hypothetical protein
VCNRQCTCICTCIRGNVASDLHGVNARAPALGTRARKHQLPVYGLGQAQPAVVASPTIPFKAALGRVTQPPTDGSSTGEPYPFCEPT